jgi:hypothetical protein
MEKPSTSQLETAYKKARKEESFALLQISYSYFVMPWEAALEIVRQFKYAEVLADNYNEKVKITPIKEGDINLTAYSTEKYRLIKAAEVMGVTYKELQDAINNPVSSTTSSE